MRTGGGGTAVGAAGETLTEKPPPKYFSEAVFLWPEKNFSKKLAGREGRKTTVGETPNGAVIEGADWIVVRSCFCRRERCPHFETGDDCPAKS